VSQDDTAPEKERMQRVWGRRGAYWDKHADALADMADRFNQPMLELAGIGPGQRVLDLASGAGEPALSIARTVGPSGEVYATDIVPEMLAGARRRAADAGLEAIRFEIADMEALPFPDGRFDRVTCRFGLMFCPNPVAALSEARRVLAPGGRVAFMVWGPRHESTLFDVLASAAAVVFGEDEDIDYTTPFRFAEPGSLAAAMTQAGLAGAEEQALQFAPRVPADMPFWEAQVEMGIGHRLARATEAERAALDAALRAGFGQYIKDDFYHLSVHARLGLAAAPAG